MSAGNFRAFFAAIFAAILAVSTLGCSPLVRERTLPPSINNVYLPMILNRTSEPGLDEELTIALQKEILADGRLKLTSKKRADAIIEVVLTGFDNQAFLLDEDDFPVIQKYLLETQIFIYENTPGKPIIGEPRKMITEFGYNADTRTTYFDPEPRNREVFADLFAKQAVLEILTGKFSEEDTPLDQNNTRPRTEKPRFEISS